MRQLHTVRSQPTMDVPVSSASPCRSDVLIEQLNDLVQLRKRIIPVPHPFSAERLARDVMNKDTQIAELTADLTEARTELLRMQELLRDRDDEIHNLQVTLSQEQRKHTAEVDRLRASVQQQLIIAQRAHARI